MTFLNNLSFKLKSTGIRIIDIFKLFPERIKRFGNHLLCGFQYFLPMQKGQKDKNTSTMRLFVMWWAQLLFFGLDCVGISELYESFMDFWKFNTRPLEYWEKQLAASVFGDSINYDRVRIDQSAYLGPKQQKFCYVSFNTINSWERMPNYIFIHEMVHVWQYQKLGAIYIVKAIEAQYSEQGYNYGGIDMLRHKLRLGQNFLDFNFERGYYFGLLSFENGQ